MGFFEQLSLKYSQLTKQNKKIADFIRAEPDRALTMTAKDMGKVTGTSPAAMIRLVHQLGYDSLEGMKIALAKSLSVNEQPTAIDMMITAEDRAPDLGQKLFGNVNSALQETMSLMNFQVLEQAVALLTRANRIFFYAIGGSALAAADLSHKLARIGKTSLFQFDGHTNLEFAALTTKRDVAVCISYSGETREVYLAAKAARQNGTPIISITRTNTSTLVGLSDLILLVPPIESRVRIGTIGSKFSQMLICDLLYLAVLQTRLEQHETALLKTSKMTRQLKEEAEESASRNDNRRSSILNINQLPTEQRNQDTMKIDEVSTLEMVSMINNEDKKVPYAIENHLDQIAAAIDAASLRFANGGRIVYCGAGTSGRLGFMDAAECPPTFGVSRDQVMPLIAGGIDAMAKAKEGAEDSKELCIEDLKAIDFCEKDVLVGLAASGRTPYVVGGMEYAKSIGAATVSVTCNEDLSAPVNALADYPIGIYAGPEAITGSTRMKAGTVQKLVLNMLSTGIMIKTGKVYSNLMVNVQTTNEKLVDRAHRIVQEITGATTQQVEEAMKETDNDVALSSFMLMSGLPKQQAAETLQAHQGRIKDALRTLNK